MHLHHSKYIKHSITNGFFAKIKRLPVFLLCMSVLVLTACASNFPDEKFDQEPLKTTHSTFTLGPGDKIRISVYEHDNLSGNFGIDDTGRLSLPLLQGIEAKGLTLVQLENKIANELKLKYIVNPDVSIETVKLRPFCILGEVRNPGCFSHLPGMSSEQAIAIAGGFTYRAYKEKFGITRESGRRITGFEFTPVFGGDTIEVFERYF